MFVLLIAVGLFATRFLIASKKAIPTSDIKESIVNLRVKKVSYESVDYTLEYTGRVTGNREVNLSAQVGGELFAGDLTFKKGQNFRKGDVLFRVEDNKTRALLQSQKSSLLTQLSKLLPDIEVDFPNEFNKWKSFFGKIDFDKKLPALPDFSNNKEKVFMASNNIISKYYDIVQHEITLDRHTIRAPFDGSVVSCNTEVGSIANPGASLGTIISTDVLEIDVPVKAEDVKKLKRGMICSVKGNSKDVSGKISRIAGFRDKQTQMVSVFVKVDGTYLMEGDYMKVNFDLKSEVPVESVPREAVTRDGYIYTIDSGKLNKKKIEVEQILPDAVLFKGLPEETYVVTESNPKLSIGTKVEMIL